MDSVAELPNSGKAQQFSMSFGDEGEQYVVRFEERGFRRFIAQYGIYPGLTVYPDGDQIVSKLEVVQFLGKLWGDASMRMPEQIRSAYQIWLRGIENQLRD